MSDRVLFTLALLTLALMGTLAMVAMDKVPVDNRPFFATVLLGFLATVATVLAVAFCLLKLPTRHDVQAAADQAVEKAAKAADDTEQ